jgi:hypothetical protein
MSDSSSIFTVTLRGWPAALVAEVAAAPCRRVGAALIKCSWGAIDALSDHGREALLTQLHDVLAELPDIAPLADSAQRPCGNSPRAANGAMKWLRRAKHSRQNGSSQPT